MPPVKYEYDWPNINESIQWVATNFGGERHGFSHEPTLDKKTGIWKCGPNENDVTGFLHPDPRPENYENSLQQRPVVA
jgi:hypothetical protein